LSYYLLKVGEHFFHILLGYVAILLAALFLLVQYVEYTEAFFTINDSVFGSFFYMLTGFHGFHVTVGFIFLVEQYERMVCSVYANATYIYDTRKYIRLTSFRTHAKFMHSLCTDSDTTEVEYKLRNKYLSKIKIRPSFYCVVNKPEIPRTRRGNYSFNMHKYVRNRNKQSFPRSVQACLCFAESGVFGHRSELRTAMYDRQRHTGITAGIMY
jgi:hypothetical protein